MSRPRRPTAVGARVDPRGSTFLGDERGAVTAEFAIAVPAVLLVLCLVIGAINLSAERVALAGLTGDLARLEARGDRALAAERLAGFGGSPEIAAERRGGLLCVRARSSSGLGLPAALSVSVEACAAVLGPSGARGS